MNLQQWYSLALEYINAAHENSELVKNSKQVEQYYQLIDLAIHILMSLKDSGKWSLTIKQDLCITMRLVNLLLEETLNIDMAENYLSSLLERLQNQPMDLTIWNYQNLIQYWLLYEIPIRRNTNFHLRIALHNYQDLLSNQVDYKNENSWFSVNAELNTYYSKIWPSIFEYVASQLYCRLRKYKSAQRKLESLIKNTNLKMMYPQWYVFLFIKYIALLLGQRLSIPDNIWSQLTNDELFNNCSIIGPILYSWKLLLQLCIMINKDFNITDILKEFKVLFQDYKEQLSLNDDLDIMIFKISLDDDNDSDVSDQKFILKFRFDSFLTYKDIKLILLLLQSVSYLVNCYDKNAQFSIKFLPKVENSLKMILQDGVCSNSSSQSKELKSLLKQDTVLQWYNNILEYCKFYQVWEKMLLSSPDASSSMSELVSMEDSATKNNFICIKSIPLHPFYKDIIKTIRKQIDLPFTLNNNNYDHDLQINEILNDYNKMIKNKVTSIEIKLISLLNSYILVVSKISNESDSIPFQDKSMQSYITQTNELWSQIITIYQEKSENNGNNNNDRIDIKENMVWDCTIVIIWIITHFEPFTWNPLPSNDKERNEYLKRLKKYYINNKIINHNNDGGDNINLKNQYILKKSMLLRILINYLGGKLFETDLEVLCQISLKCFKFAKQDRHLINIRYIIGLWHLMNCTVAMKPKEVAYTTAKLNQLVQQMLNS
ncbi:cohesin-loading factor complex subunit SCC4 PWA37_002029 [Arxiozyma heterogenica]|uniref:Uncharacterized protein n=1 Tax=Arxiozyma heterogenica TaxID=278026 RepID=A0AAN7WID3_9SACH|nr:hypothetical protein RI543_001494 [Kazachstania heterogenica]